jgi:hypothetical protein
LGKNPIRDKKCPSLLKTHLEPPYENYTGKPLVMIIASPTRGKILHCDSYVMIKVQETSHQDAGHLVGMGENPVAPWILFATLGILWMAHAFIAWRFPVPSPFVCFSCVVLVLVVVST